MGRALLIAGTGTDVGKTHVAAALLAALQSRSLRALALKPVASGVIDAFGDDARVHAAALGASPREPIFAYARAVSPHLAAREEGRPIAIEPIVREACALVAAADVLVIETAGGLFSPLGPRVCNATLASALRRELGALDVVLVAPDRIGVLHDLTACLLAATAAGLARPHVVLSSPQARDPSTGTNAGEARTLGIAEVACVFPRAPYAAPESLASAAALLALLAI
jgi:dethiobiotin synthetase